MKKVKSVLIFSIFALVVSGFGWINHAGAVDNMTGSANGIKATLKIDISKSMMDLYLADSGTSRAITDARVVVLIIGPKGRKDEKKLMAMRMGDAYSYMAMTDMYAKGRYTFDIKVESGKNNTNFHFSKEVK